MLGLREGNVQSRYKEKKLEIGLFSDREGGRLPGSSPEENESQAEKNNSLKADKGKTEQVENRSECNPGRSHEDGPVS